MINENNLTAPFSAIRRRIKEQAPLIHCITHPITMNDCANLVLTTGAKPHMASHPQEVAEVTAGAAALAVNLGNITDDRMLAMRRAAETAREAGIPVLIDLVGVAGSTLRRDFACRFIADYRPAVIKGNSSEMKAVCGLPSHEVGVDAGAADAVTTGNYTEAERLFGQYAAAQHTVVLVSGAIDMITDGHVSCGVTNGTPLLTQLTGTGCMLGALAGTYLAAGSPWQAAVLSAVTMGLAGEYAAIHATGMGSFHMALFDAFTNLTDEQICTEARFV